MKKRLLCYDADNPVGVDSNGVLNPSALGGSVPDIIFSCEDLATSMHLVDNVLFNEKTNISSGSYDVVKYKLLNYEIINATFEYTYVYSGVSSTTILNSSSVELYKSTTDEYIQIVFINSMNNDNINIEILYNKNGTMHASIYRNKTAV